MFVRGLGGGIKERWSFPTDFYGRGRSLNHSEALKWNFASIPKTWNPPPPAQRLPCGNFSGGHSIFRVWVREGGLHRVPNLYLPSANKVCEGYVFTPVCHSVHGEVWPSACWDNPPEVDTPPPGADPPREQTDTAVDGTHPTGMHSCYQYFRLIITRQEKSVFLFSKSSPKPVH